MSVMFAANSGSGRSANGNLYEFKAGIAKLEPGSATDKRKVVSDKAKGLVYIKQSQDQLMHFYWKNRESNSVDLDLIIFPGDTEFLRVKECTDGRMFMLKFKNTSDERRLFWLQEPNKDKDDELMKRVNDVLNNPPPHRTGARGGTSERTALSALASLNNGDEIGALGSMDQNQLMQLFSLMQGSNSDIIPQFALGRSNDKEGAMDDSSSGVDPVPGQLPTSSSGIGNPDRGTPVSTSGKKQSRIDADQLRSILNHLPTNASSSAATKAKVSKQPPPSLAKVFKNADRDTIAKHESELTPHLPSSDIVKQDAQEMRDTIDNRTFRSAADHFGAALETGMMQPVLEQFDLPKEAAEAHNLKDLAKAMTDAYGPKTTKEAGSKKRRARDISNVIPEIDEQINRDAEAQETTESAVHEPAAKKGKPDDDKMDLD